MPHSKLKKLLYSEQLDDYYSGFLVLKEQFLNTATRRQKKLDDGAITNTLQRDFGVGFQGRGGEEKHR